MVHPLIYLYASFEVLFSELLALVAILNDIETGKVLYMTKTVYTPRIVGLSIICYTFARRELRHSFGDFHPNGRMGN